jgi:hypothetical protein
LAVALKQQKGDGMKAAPLLLPIVVAVHLFAQSPCETSGPIPFRDHGKWGYVSAKGIVIPPRFDLAGLFTAEGAIACVANQCGLVDRTGLFVAPSWNRESRPFPENYSEGLAPANGPGQLPKIGAGKSVNWLGTAVMKCNIKLCTRCRNTC